MARASNGDEVDTEMAKKALQYGTDHMAPAITRLGQFYQSLDAMVYWLYAMDDEQSGDHNEDFMEYVRGNDPSAWDNARQNISEIRSMVEVYVAEEYSDEVVWTLDHDADVEVEL